MQDLLSLELVSSRRGGGTPDLLQVYRKGRPGQQEEEPLAHELHCDAHSEQVRHLDKNAVLPYNLTIMFT